MPLDPEENLLTPSFSIDGDEEELTSIMSPDQRKALQHAAAKEAETLERDTARPPPPAGATPAVVIPKAASVPAPMIAQSGPGRMGEASIDTDDGPVSRVRRSEPAGAAAIAPPTGAVAVASRASAPSKPAATPKAEAPAPSSGASLSVMAIVPFVLLALAVAAALRM
jgi:hypothetical protein